MCSQSISSVDHIRVERCGVWKCAFNDAPSVSSEAKTASFNALCAGRGPQIQVNSNVATWRPMSLCTACSTQRTLTTGLLSVCVFRSRCPSRSREATTVRPSSPSPSAWEMARTPVSHACTCVRNEKSFQRSRTLTCRVYRMYVAWKEQCC